MLAKKKGLRDLSEGMYIRTKDGVIAQVEYIDGKTAYFNNDLYRTYGGSINFLVLNDSEDVDRIFKFHFNIKYVVSIGDIVEIDVTDEDNYPTLLGINLIRIDDGMQLESIFDMLENESAKLIRVLTKEEFERRSYKVGE